MSNAAPAVTNTERFMFVHLLRGLASLLVVWSHLSGFWLLENGRSSALQDLWYQLIARPFHVFQNGGHLGVVLFFLISGYIITHTSLRESRREFAIKRTMRIFPPLAIATVVAAVLLGVAAVTGTRLIGTNSGTPLEWVASLFLLDGFISDARIMDVTWTLVIELLFYTITLITMGLTRRSPVSATWVMTAVWLAVFVASTSLPFVSATINSALPVYLAFLLAGRAIYLWHSGRAGALSAAVLTSSHLVVYMVFTETLSPGFLLAPGGWVGLEPLVTYAYALLIFLGCLVWAPSRLWAPFRVLGDISYSLYLLHLPVGITVLNLLDLLGVPETINTLIAIAVSLVVAYAMYRLVETPSQRFARRLISRPQHGSPAGEPPASPAPKPTAT